MLVYKKIKIYYFSGTGNAKRISYWIREFAAEKNMICNLENIDTARHNSIDIDPGTLVIIISPIHGFNYPPITLGFIRQFPKGSNDIILMNTRAGLKIGKTVTPGLTGIAFFVSTIMLKMKGYKIKGQIPFDMPSNWMSIHPALNKNAVAFLHEANFYKVKKYCDRIFEGNSVFVSYRDIVQDILISPISLGYYIAGRFAFAKSFYASTACDGCQLCVKQCPVKAIKILNKRPFWLLKCESCMRCMSLCPKRAIESAHGLFVIISIFYSTLATYLLNKLSSDFLHYPFVEKVFSFIVFFILLIFFYRIQHLFLLNKYTGRLISFFSLTHYKFWGRYRSIADAIWRQKKN